MSERKILMSGPLKGMVTVQQDQSYQDLTTFRQCFNARPEGGSLVYDLNMDRNNSINLNFGSSGYSEAGPTWVGVAKSGSNTPFILASGDGYVGWGYISIDVDLKDFSVLAPGIQQLGTVLPTPSGTPKEGGWSRATRFTDSSDNDLLFINRVGAQPFYVDLVAKTKTTMTDAFLYDTKRFVVNQSVMFAAVGDKIYYSAVNDGTTWVSTDFERTIEAGEVIYDMFVINGIVVIFTNSNIYTMTGNDSSSIELKLLSNVGCGIWTAVDGDSNSCYFLDVNGKYNRISGNPHYFGIQSIVDIGRGKLSPTYSYDVDGNPTANTNNNTGTRVVVVSNHVFFGGYPGPIYNIDDDNWWMGYNWVDNYNYPVAGNGPLVYGGMPTTNTMNIPWQNAALSLSKYGLNYRVINDEDTSTNMTQVNYPYNGKPFIVKSQYCNYGTTNMKVLNKVFVDFDLLDDDEIGITLGIRGDSHELLYNSTIPASSPVEYYTFPMKKSGWITVPSNCRSRKFSISIHCNTNKGFKLNSWGVDFTDLGQGAY